MGTDFHKYFRRTAIAGLLVGLLASPAWGDYLKLAAPDAPCLALVDASLHTPRREFFATSDIDARKIFDALVTDPEVKFLFNADAQVNERFTVGEHTLRALSLLDTQLAHFPLADTESAEPIHFPSLLKATLALHDIGKGPAIEAKQKHHQHQYTLPILTRKMRLYGFSEAEIKIARALVENDVLGELGKRTLEPAEAIKRIEALAARCQLSPEAFFRLQFTFYTSDAGSYPSLRGHFATRSGVVVPKDPKFELLAARFGAGPPLALPSETGLARPGNPLSPRSLSPVKPKARAPPALNVRADQGVTETARLLTEPMKQHMRFQAQAGPHEFDLPQTPGLSDAQRSDLLTRLKEMAGRSSAGLGKARHVLRKLKKMIAQDPRGLDYHHALGPIGSAMRDLNSLPAIKIATRPAAIRSRADPSMIRSGASIAEIEKNFDILSRKASAPRSSYGEQLHEVDVAFAAGGIPEYYVNRDEKGGFFFSQPKNETVFSVGAQGAIHFKGKRSNKGGERLYALIFEKGFVERYGEDLRRAGGITLSEQTFAKDYAPHGSVFVVRSEISTRDLGQVHVKSGEGWLDLEIDGKIISQADFLRQHAIGVVEFDADGQIIATRLFEHRDQ